MTATAAKRAGAALIDQHDAHGYSLHLLTTRVYVVELWDGLHPPLPRHTRTLYEGSDWEAAARAFRLATARTARGAPKGGRVSFTAAPITSPASKSLWAFADVYRGAWTRRITYTDVPSPLAHALYRRPVV